MSNEIIIKLTDGAVRNGYIQIPQNQELFGSKYQADNEKEAIPSTFILVADDGTEFETYILKNRGRLKQRFNAYFKKRNIQPETSVCLSEIEKGKYKMEFNSGKKSIKELYEDYKKNPRTKWIKEYTQRSNQLSEYKGKPPGDYDTALLKDIWETPANGIANASPGFMSKIEFENLLDDLPEITSKIVEDPSSDTLNDVMYWAEQAKREGKFKTVKKGIINRVFSAANPLAYSTIINKKMVIELIHKLNEIYGLGVVVRGNWVALNINLMQAIKSQGLEDEDIFMVNTFVWKLYQTFVGDKSVSDKVEKGEEGNIQSKISICENVIYYGPPGTGKTYKLQKLLKQHYTDTAIKPDKHLWLTDQIEKLNWYEVIILVLMGSGTSMKVADIVAHQYYRIKAELNERNEHLRNTAWSSLNSHAIAESITVNSKQRIEPLIFDKKSDSSWFINEAQKDQLEEYKTLFNQLKAGPAIEDTIKRYEFVTFHQSYGYEEFIEGLRPETNDEGNISYDVKPGVFKRICKRAQADPDNRYAMVIDEINRGNISKIFGELITLVEVDKRAGLDNELTLTLPYSGATFSVPSNLDIIGTMNTADRSLTHIDVALRRRFDFKELRTDYLLIPENVDGINLKWMLYAMNQRIELLLDREHILGHALLMHVRSLEDIAHVFKTNIMPLLEEYFFEHWGKINQVLNNNGFIEEKKNAHNTWLRDMDEYAAKSYRFNLNTLQDIEAYKDIYAGVDHSAFADCDKVKAVV